MVSDGTLLAVLSLSAVPTNGAIYWPKVAAVEVPKNPRVEQAVMAAGLLLAAQVADLAEQILQQEERGGRREVAVNMSK